MVAARAVVAWAVAAVPRAVGAQTVIAPPLEGTERVGAASEVD